MLGFAESAAEDGHYFFTSAFPNRLARLSVATDTKTLCRRLLPQRILARLLAAALNLATATPSPIAVSTLLLPTATVV